MKVKIGNYYWKVEFDPNVKLDGADGQTQSNELKILIRNDLSKEVTRAVLIHEIVHATLDMQGRVYQENFNVEEVCEFIAWNIDSIKEIVDYCIKEFYK